MWKKFLSLLLSILMVLIGFPSLKLSICQETPEYTIAVFDLSAKGISQSEAEYLSEYLRGQVIRVVTSKKYIKSIKINYTVVERSKMDEILKEHEIQMIGCVDVSCAIEFGKILNAKKVIIGSIGLVGKTYSITARVVDVETTETFAVADYMYKGSRDTLLKKGIPSIAYELLYGKKPKKSRKTLYLLAGLAVIGGVAAWYLNNQEDKVEYGKIIIDIPWPE